ncbi:uncharacterized protein BDZ83DRAFT_612690 [Colletotrichum acutatum]|uniref:Uncharacterized protein n=1 Tax=Glomerella acutata TaxID=27357 RepID=A0AAD8XJS5_GLOAC|nr:uncharacterized protein BDZ83DRAFT_612690 [Colletotrichum acutatum]KAK1727410.1 hypothetical protein BDZ83DRAFT_612690 [Colletotrichum acutatum]
METSLNLTFPVLTQASLWGMGSMTLRETATFDEPLRNHPAPIRPLTSQPASSRPTP